MIKTGEKWIIGKPFLSNFFITIDLNNQLITFSDVYTIEKIVPATFETFYGWSYLLGIIVAMIIIYFVAIYIFNACKKKIADENTITFLEEKYKKIYNITFMTMQVTNESSSIYK